MLPLSDSISDKEDTNSPAAELRLPQTQINILGMLRASLGRIEGQMGQPLS